MPRRCRSTLTRDTRRIFASCSWESGCASGSDRAAARTSSSVMASSCAQSVLPRGSVSPGFTVTRVVPVLLMSRGPPGRYDSACILAGERHNHEKHLAMGHSDDLNALLAIDEPVVDLCSDLREQQWHPRSP